MRGVILAGGMGTRLRPLTFVANKHLLPIYDKPMIMYPIETLKQMGITEILIVSGGENIGKFAEYLKDGSDFGVKINFVVQAKATGIAGALSLAEGFMVPGEKFAVILGDNIFEHAPFPPIGNTCGIVVKKVEDPHAFGVLHEGKIIEKPKEFISDQAVLGLYFYTTNIFEYIRGLKPSERGELEITDVNNYCLTFLPTDIIKYEGVWYDAGSFDSLLEVGNWAKNAKN